MPIIAPQVFAFVILTSVALCSAISMWRDGRRSLAEIIACFSTKPPHLWELSSNGPFSQGLDCPADELWSRVGGVPGIWIMLYNLGVLIDVLHHMESWTDLSAVQMRSIKQLRGDAVPVRVSVLCKLVSASTEIMLGRTVSELSTCVRSYLEILTRANLVMHDADPELMRGHMQYMGRRDENKPAGD